MEREGALSVRLGGRDCVAERISNGGQPQRATRADDCNSEAKDVAEVKGYRSDARTAGTRWVLKGGKMVARFGRVQLGCVGS